MKEGREIAGKEIEKKDGSYGAEEDDGKRLCVATKEEKMVTEVSPVDLNVYFFGVFLEV